MDGLLTLATYIAVSVGLMHLSEPVHAPSQKVPLALGGSGRHLVMVLWPYTSLPHK